jgi:hypothetical protein
MKHEMNPIKNYENELITILLSKERLYLFSGSCEIDTKDINSFNGVHFLNSDCMKERKERIEILTK